MTGHCIKQTQGLGEAGSEWREMRCKGHLNAVLMTEFKQPDNALMR